MTDVLEKCAVCHAILDEEDLFCANCGTEAPHRDRGAAPTRTSTVNFVCSGCGAAMSYDASAQTLRCPFCGSEKLEKDQDAKVLAPKFVVPFSVPQEQAVNTLRAWLGRGFWRPGDLATAAVVTKLTAVYVPYWVFSAKTYTYWTADTSRTPPGARASWFPISGEHRGAYSGLLIGASSALTPAETSAICPFDLAQGVPPEQVDLDNIVVENFRVQRKYARPLAQAGLENLDRQACQQYVPGNARNVKVNVRLEGLSSEPALVPVWIMAYQYRDQLYRFLLNGQSGRCTGQAPVSYRKILVVIGIVILVLLGILACMGAFSGLGALMSARTCAPDAILGEAFVRSRPCASWTVRALEVPKDDDHSRFAISQWTWLRLRRAPTCSRAAVECRRSW
jgi:predicted RNA-binding Zn-ribbon protein involved in translation (DUF1610 family)